MAILAIWALLLTAPTPAAAPVSPAASVRMVSAPGVIVKLGDASLEEYAHGDPAGRIQLSRSNYRASL